MAEQKFFNDQTIARAIRKSVERFGSAEDLDGKLRAIMALAALGAAGLINNGQMRVSTASYIESRLR